MPFPLYYLILIMQTIGVLLPRSTYYTGLSFDLFEGLKASLRELKREDLRIVTENIGFGTDKQQCYKAAEQLIMHENAQVIVAYVGHRMAQVLRPLFLAANRLLIVMDAGANVPQEWPESPNIIYHSLHNAFGSWLTAKKAVRDGFTLGGMVTGYYDGGYLQTWGISNGFTQAGGQIIFNHATGYSREDFSMEPLKNYLQEYPESALLSIFSGDYVQWYFSALKGVFGNEQLPIYLPPFALEETMLQGAVYPGNKTQGVAVWSKQLKNEQNQQFIDVITTSGRTPNLFSLLAWETSVIAVQAMELLKENSFNVQHTTEALNNFSFESPRGTIRFHSGTKHTIAPMYEAEIIDDGNGHCAVQIGAVIPETEADFETFIAHPMENSVSGWYNSYTCI